MNNREIFIANSEAITPECVVKQFPIVESVVLICVDERSMRTKINPWLHTMEPVYKNSLQRLYLENMSITDEDLHFLASNFIELRSLSLIRCDGFYTVGLAAVAKHCRKLEVLRLVGNDTNNEVDEMAVDWISSFPAENESKLESLILQGTTGWKLPINFNEVPLEKLPINFNALVELGSRSHKLRRLDMDPAKLTSSHLLLLLNKIPWLTHLGMGNRKQEDSTTDDKIDDLNDAFTNSADELRSFTGIPIKLSAFYPACEKLCTLDFSMASISAEELKPMIKRCTSLQKFVVFERIGDEGLVEVGKSCPQLTELVVKYFCSENISDVGLNAISRGCRKLRRIQYTCARMTNKALVTLSENCNDLEDFCFSVYPVDFCFSVYHVLDYKTNQPFDVGVGAIVMRCKLKRLKITKAQITSMAFMQIGKYGKEIQTLILNEIQGNKDLGFNYIFEGCKSLLNLRMYCIPTFVNAHLLQGFMSCSKMRSVFVSACKQISKEGCNDVRKIVPGTVVDVIGDLDNECLAERVVYIYRLVAWLRETPLSETFFEDPYF